MNSPCGLRVALLGCGALLMLCAGLGVFAARAAPSASAAELEQAQLRWSERPFVHYRLLLRDKRCLQDIEVLHERVVDVEPNRCEPPPRTISDLFTLIRRNGEISTPCIALGCACEDVITVRAEYDARLGHPTRIEVRVTARPNWRHPDYWSYLVRRRRLPDCNMLAEGSKRIEVVSITPIE
ncbi:MAG: hypothetical protein DIU80_005225 [Chloroflexota bacterium]